MFCVTLVSLVMVSGVVGQSNASTTNSMDVDVPVSWKTYFFAVLICCVFVALMRSVAPVFSVLASAGMVLYITDIINDVQLFSGLVNNGVLSIAMLYVVVHPVVDLPLMKLLIQKVLGNATTANNPVGSHPLNTGANALSPEMLSTGRWARLKVCLMSLMISPFLENTPHTAMVTPLLSEHCRKIGLAPSQILMPMTFAVLLGNYFPLGFSSNLVVSGLMEKHGFGELPLFELAKVNLPMLLPVLAYLVFVPRYLLPLRRGGITFYSRIKVTHSSKLVGCTVSDILSDFLSSRTENSEKVAVLRRSNARTSILRSLTWEKINEPFSRLVVLQAGDELVIGGLTATIGQSSSSIESLGDEMATQSAYISPVEMEKRAEGDDVSASASIQVASDADALLATQVAAGHAIARQGCPIVAGTIESALHNIIVASFDYCSPDPAMPAPPTSPRLSSRHLRPDDEKSHQAKLRKFCNELGVMVMSLKVDLGGMNLMKDDSANAKAPNIAASTRLLALPRDPDAPESPTSPDISDSKSKSLLGASSKESDMSWSEWHIFKGGRMFRVSVPHWLPLGEPEQVEQDPDVEVALPRTDIVDPHSLVPEQIYGNDDKEKQPQWRVVRLPWWYEYLSLLIFLGIVIAAFFDTKLSISCFVACIACVALRLVSTKDMIKALPIEVYLLVAFSFPLGSGMIESGLASTIGDGLVDAHVTGYPLLLLVGSVTLILTNMITSQGCVQVVFPLVVKVYEARQLHPMPGIMMMLSTLSVALCTPFAIASNAVILVPGGYEPLDYFKFGAPLSLMMLLGLSVCVASVYDDY
jgi:di/tricarboxylate transporter